MVVDAEVLQVGTLVLVKNSAWIPAIVAAVYPGPKYDVEFKNGQVWACLGRNCALRAFMCTGIYMPCEKLCYFIIVRFMRGLQYSEGGQCPCHPCESADDKRSGPREAN